MLDHIKKFYERVMLHQMQEDPKGEEIPITFTHVFHKEYPRLLSIPLPESKKEDSFLETLLEMRESVRTFSDQPLELELLAQILRSCRIVDRGRFPERRTYPSGGARFPVELYVIANNIGSLTPGAYHFNVKKESLELLLAENLRYRSRELISPYLENPQATIIFTSVLARSEVKYGARAYPYSLIEAGHMGQNIHLTCAELGVSSCSVSGFVDDSVKDILDLTDDEIPLYTISLGWKRQGV